jgi:hypothetical protein
LHDLCGVCGVAQQGKSQPINPFVMSLIECLGGPLVACVAPALYKLL